MHNLEVGGSIQPPATSSNELSAKSRFSVKREDKTAVPNASSVLLYVSRSGGYTCFLSLVILFLNKKEGGLHMNIGDLEHSAGDTSISDEALFKIILTHFEEKEQQAANTGPRIISMDSLEARILEEESVCFRSFMLEKRPVVFEMLRQHIMNEHQYCCGPRSRYPRFVKRFLIFYDEIRSKI